MLAKTGIQVDLMHEFMPPELFLVFQQQICPIHYFRSKTRVSGGFALFRRRTRPVAKTSIGVHLIECFRIVGLQTYYLEDFNVLFMSKTHILGIFTPFHCSTTSVWFRTTYFTSKTHVSGGFTPFHCHTRPIMKISIGCIKCTSLCLRNHFLFCRIEHAQSTISV